MTNSTLYDNDAVLKLSAYGCWEALSITEYFPPAILKVATFSLASQAKKARRVTDVDAFRTALEQFMRACQVFEPTESEIRFATELEERAIAADEEFDTGESLLVAVLVSRLLPRLVTGDKRAMKALAALKFDLADGRLCSIEQVLRTIVADGDWAALRSRVCAERAKDTAVAMAFGCHSTPDQASILEGLDSYIANTRATAGAILAD